ncbi:MAG: alpha/beta hydrolase [Deltaproteobacteria bacterium]|nr:alpha/beta hydrolase [Deltaproteobacteria bacterium]
MGNLKNTTAMNGLFAAEYFDLESQAVGETFRIFVAKPMVMEPDNKYPAIYILDGNGMFASVMEMQRLMSMGNEIPPAFVVGVGYAVEDGFTATMDKRYRDYTPTVGGEVEAASKVKFDSTYDIQPGGGAAFLKFLREELKGVLESAYPLDPDDTAIGGASLGGLFLSWVLLTRPEAFHRYIICSPSIWWHKEAVWQWEEDYAAERKDLNATVFVTAGGLETVDIVKPQFEAMVQVNGPMKEVLEKSIAAYEKHGWPRMAEITPVLVDKLRSRNYPGLKIHCHNLPDETHLSVVPGAMSRGLRYVFGHWDP